MKKSLPPRNWFTDALLDNTEQGLEDEGIFFGNKLNKMNLGEFRELAKKYKDQPLAKR